MRLQNSGHNCIAGQVVILSSDWPQRDAFLAALRARARRRARAPVWYPRSDEKLDGCGIRLPERRPVARRRHARCSSRSAPGADATALETDGVLRARARRRRAARATARSSSTRPSRTRTSGSPARSAPTCSIDPATQAALGRRVRARGRRPALRRDRDQRVDGLRIPHARRSPGAASPARRSRTSRAASASCTTPCCSTAGALGHPRSVPALPALGAHGELTLVCPSRRGSSPTAPPRRPGAC